MLINRYYDDCYFDAESGYRESKYVFFDGNELSNNSDDKLYIGETGFGTGLNLLVLEDSIHDMSVIPKQITFTTVEKYPLKPDQIRYELEKLEDVSDSSLQRHMDLYHSLYNKLQDGWNSISIKREWGELYINLFIGDVMELFKKYPVKNTHWFLDGHSPDKNPEMWSEHLFREIAECSIEGSTFATFTAAGLVKQGLRNAGFYVKRIKGFGKKRHMIRGYFTRN